MKKKLLIVLAAFTTTVVVFLMVIVVPIDPADKDRRVKTGIVSKVDLDSDTKDINILLGNTHYYINRGLEKVMNTDSLQNALSGKAVSITYYEPSFDVMGNLFQKKARHIYKIESSKKTIFDEVN